MRKPAAKPDPASQPAAPADRQEAVDWQFAFERSEVMRAFQQELLVSIGHELRNPLSSQMGSLQLVLSDLCDSPEEEREYIQSAKESVERLIKLLEEYTRLARHDLPIQPLQPEPTQLRPLLQDVYSLTRLQAQDQGIRYEWPILQPPSVSEPSALPDSLMVWADPHGLVQALLGVCRWGIRALRYGSMALHLYPIAAAEGHLCLEWNLEGRCHVPVETKGSATWRVSERLLREMGGDLELGESGLHRVVIKVTLRLIQ
ncbi:sensor histidine kinase [Synechococcus sp. H55.7]|uniref:sensor histidine kinase n=1 Tax=unclassified Synechococcus TaxID=2626047 RepID=UPI0039C39673